MKTHKNPDAPTLTVPMTPQLRRAINKISAKMSIERGYYVGKGHTAAELLSTFINVMTNA